MMKEAACFESEFLNKPLADPVRRARLNSIYNGIDYSNCHMMHTGPQVAPDTRVELLLLEAYSANRPPLIVYFVGFVRGLRRRFVLPQRFGLQVFPRRQNHRLHCHPLDIAATCRAYCSDFQFRVVIARYQG